MEKDINKLISKETLTGDEVGRIMILDLLVAYKNMNETGQITNVLSNSQKIEIVSRLTDISDISRYNDFKGVHDYLTNASSVFDSFAKSYEICFCKIYHLLSDMMYSEYESHFSRTRPIIMTESQYKHFMESGEKIPDSGLAILHHIPEISESNSSGCIDENGFYTEAMPTWRDKYSAENILHEYSPYIREALEGMKDALCECIARQKALELIGHFIKVPQVKILICPVDEKRVELLNSFIQTSIGRVKREGAYDMELKEKLNSLFVPIDLSVLTPDQKSVVRARRALNFDLIKSGSEAFVSMLKREWRNDIPQ